MNFKDCNIYYTFDKKEDFRKQDFQSIIITDMDKKPHDLYEQLGLETSTIKAEHLYEGHLPARFLEGIDENDFILEEMLAVYYVRFVSSLTGKTFQKIIVSDLDTEIYQEVMDMYDNIQVIEKAACIIPHKKTLI
ncbi:MULTISPECIES: hypothetical protein [unclassified Enterococcus]|jgi:uncharacterized protein (DUF2164 family)|uniref:hypothetical protein n=1 Tax=unclassified Enterococcus TaxID=2608891 RepID=UPI003D2E5ABE